MSPPGHEVVHQIVVACDRVEDPPHPAGLLAPGNALKSKVGGSIVCHWLHHSPFRPIMAPTGALFGSRCAPSSPVQRIINPLLLFHVAFLKQRWAESIPDTGVLNGRGRALKSPAFFF